MKPSEVLPSIHDFLMQCKLTKAAKALRKEAELVDDVGTVPLFDAVNEWIERHNDDEPVVEKKKKNKKRKLDDAATEDEPPAAKEKKKKKEVVNGAPKEDEPVKKKKKKKVDDGANEEEQRRVEAVAAAEAWIQQNASAPVAKPTKREPGKPFSRVDSDKWLSQANNSKLSDNSYEGTYGANGYGAKASQKLIKVKGKDFRHEKTKKKRGNYRGGTIDLGTNSIKFD